MIRATTPTHIFNLPFETNTIKELSITYSQRKTPLVQKNKGNCAFDGKVIALTLSQKDTLKFSDRRPVEIQLRVLTTSNTSLAGTITEIDVGRILDDNILGSDPELKPIEIINDQEVLSNCCCAFDVEFKEVYIVDTGGGMPGEYEGEYAGSYEFVPKAGATQVIPTARKYLANDIVVEAIPYAEVDNTSDGKTVTIG